MVQVDGVQGQKEIQKTMVPPDPAEQAEVQKKDVKMTEVQPETPGDHTNLINLKNYDQS